MNTVIKHDFCAIWCYSQQKFVPFSDALPANDFQYNFTEPETGFIPGTVLQTFLIYLK